jgi:hypothetical protein
MHVNNKYATTKMKRAKKISIFKVHIKQILVFQKKKSVL